MTLLLLALFSGAAQAQDIPTAKVVMPWSDFKTLYEQGKAPEDKPEPAPRDFSINKAVYTGEVVNEGTAALFDVDMKIQIHKAKGWVTVPVAPTSVALKSAKLGGVDAPIFIQGGWYMLITDRKGTQTLNLEIASSVFETDGSHSLSFPMAPSGGTEVRLDVPGEQNYEFTVAQAQFIKDVQVGGVRRMEAVLPATGNLAVSWQREIDEAEVAEIEARQEQRIYAEVHTLAGVSEGVLQGHSDLNYTIVHQGVETLTVSVPKDVTVLDVTGSGIREWSVADAGELQKLTVNLNFEALGAYRLMLDYEKALPDGDSSVNVPRVVVDGAERVKGFVGVAALSTLEVVAGDVSGARRVDVRELPASIVGRTDQPVLLGYKYRQADWTLPLKIDQHEDVDVLVTIIDSGEAVTMVTQDGKIMARTSWYVRNNRRQFLRVTMPEGSDLWSVKVAGKAVKPARDEEGFVLVPLVRSQASGGALAAFTVEVVWVEDGVAPTEAGTGSIDLKVPMVDVPVTYARWTVYVPWQAKLRKWETDSNLRQVEYFSSPVTPEGQYLDMAGQAAMQQSYQAQNAATAGGVAPVDVSIPVDGQPVMFEKLLVVDEALYVHLEYRGLRK